ncbi:transcription factor E2F3 [Mastacembelus armatus]|uniref:E2F/DP family winged-helix DNA-binding domain-containing protein n=1 Tax=Mastacembelus armatus TaxID=205130 RepID=A0A7N8Y7L7_9TELE|nr:transcription factor E2F3-like [Mastacembelus armatus]
MDINARCSENSSTMGTVGPSSCPGNTMKVQFSYPPHGFKNDTPPALSTTGTRQIPKLRAQAKRRLELEASDPPDSQDGSRMAKVKKERGAGKAPAPSPIAYKPLFERSRYDTSLGLLTQRFAELLLGSADRVLDLNVVTQILNAPKRRVYDVTNVLEGVKLIKKKSKNFVEWVGGEVIIQKDQDVQALIQEELKLDELIQSCTQQVHQMCEDHQSQRFAYLTYEDVQRIPSLKEQTVIVIKAPAETKLEVPHPEECFQVYLSSTQGPIEVFLCSDDPIPMEATDASVANASHLTSSANGNNSTQLLPYTSFIQVSSKDDANHIYGINNISNTLSELTHHSPAVTVSPVSPMPTTLTSLQPPSEDQQRFVTLSPTLAFSLDGEEYLLNLTDNEGITDLFGSLDMDHLPLDMPLL